jgi:PAS domain S-box-containing protein
MLDALSNLRDLPAAGTNTIAAAAQVLAKALDCPWVAVMPSGNDEPSAALAVFVDRDGPPIDVASITLTARRFIENNRDVTGFWSDNLQATDWGPSREMAYACGHPCFDANGVLQGHAVAMSPKALADSEFSEVFTALVAQHIGGEIQTVAGFAPAIMEAVLEAVQIAISLRDAQGRYVFINRRGAESFGLNQSDILGRTLSEILGSDNNRLTIDRAFEVLASGVAVHDQEVEFKRFPGRTFSVSYAPVVDADGGVSNVVTTVRDISARKKFEADLNEKEWALAEAQRIGRIGHWRIGPDRGVMSMSEEAYRVLGFEPDEGEHTLEFMRSAVHPDDLRRLEKARDTAVANRQPYEAPRRFKWN